MVYIVDVAKLRLGSNKLFIKGDRISLSNDIAVKLIGKGYIKPATDSRENIVEVSYSEESNTSNDPVNEINSTKEEQENITDEEVETVNADSFALKHDEYVKASSDKDKKGKAI